MTDELAQARNLLEANQRERVQACQRELRALLEKHKCRLDPVVVIRGERTESQIQIVVVDE